LLVELSNSDKSGLEIIPQSGMSILDYLLKAENNLTGDMKTPAYAVLITILNLFTKWAPVLVVSGFLLPDQLRKKRTCTPQSRKGPKFKNVGSKTNANHAHRRGK